MCRPQTSRRLRRRHQGSLPSTWLHLLWLHLQLLWLHLQLLWLHLLWLHLLWPLQLRPHLPGRSSGSGSGTSTAAGFTSIDLRPAGGGGAPAASAAAASAAAASAAAAAAAAASAAAAAGGKLGAVPGRWAQRRYFRPPPLSFARCTRALFAIFVGLTLWVGVWDLVDYHLLPALTDSCKHEPSPACGALKAGLVALGALGLYCTRSLYGEKVVHAAQFQRFQ